MGSQSFKAIVVGGGPVGLTAAHALSRAGIDFVVLERRESAVIDAGSNLVLLTVGLRALGQLGLLGSLNNVSSPLETIGRLDHKGRKMGDLEFFAYDKEQFGALPRVLSRHDLTKVLYDSLSDDAKSKILTNKKVTGITSTDDGVLVSCAGGSSYDGSLVVGADGAHSMVRDSMRRLALQAGSDEVNDEKPFLTTYRCLWVRFPTTASPELYPGVTSETHGYDAATQLFAGEDTTVTGVYERMAEPTRERIRYTQADQEALVERWGDLPLTPNKKFTLRDAYGGRVQAGLVSLEEGVVKHWSWSSRVVLAGDAAHKFTPSTGAGCNNGIIDVVALANELHKAFHQAQAEAGNPGAVPTADRVEVAFKAYQQTRHDAAVQLCHEAGEATNSATWGTWVHKLVDRYFMPARAMQKHIGKLSNANTANMPVFNYVPGEEPFKGKMAWSNPVPSGFPSVKA